MWQPGFRSHRCAADPTIPGEWSATRKPSQPLAAPSSDVGGHLSGAPLGTGGMGEVYRARDTRLGRDVAIKILPPQFSSDPARKQRFEHEAKAVSNLNHPHICVLHDVGHQDGVDYLVMECMEGETLAKPVAALAGLATLTSAGAESPVTEEGKIVGTFQYMSPEQVEGKELDGRSDIFSLGAVLLYEMATGKRAFEGKSHLSVASAILEKEPQPISLIKPMTPPALDHAIRRCLAKDPEQRWQSAADLKAELMDCCGWQPGSSGEGGHITVSLGPHCALGTGSHVNPCRGSADRPQRVSCNAGPTAAK